MSWKNMKYYHTSVWGYVHFLDKKEYQIDLITEKKYIKFILQQSINPNTGKQIKFYCTIDIEYEKLKPLKTNDLIVLDRFLITTFKVKDEKDKAKDGIVEKPHLKVFSYYILDKNDKELIRNSTFNDIVKREKLLLGELKNEENN